MGADFGLGDVPQTQSFCCTLAWPCIGGAMVRLDTLTAMHRMPTWVKALGLAV
jgi:hypothetical protein